MRLLRLLVLASAAAMLLTARSAGGQDYYQDEYPASSYYDRLFSREELDNLVAPVALYPDPILAQLFIAATYPDDVSRAWQHVRRYGNAGLDHQPWDLSVKAVAHYPPVLNMLYDRPDWAAALGQAYAVQSGDVMESVQNLRRMARRHGNLRSTEYHDVIVEHDYVRIVPAHPRVIYVPVYDPYVVYYRPVFSAAIHTPYWSFGVAFPIGSWLSYDCDWGRRRVYYDGWSGGGWRSRSRPFIQIVNVYVNPRYQVINVNRTIVHRTVNYVNLNKHTTVHRNVRFDGYQRNITRIASIERENERRNVIQRSTDQRTVGAPSRGDSRISSQVQTRTQQAAPAGRGQTQARAQGSDVRSAQTIPGRTVPQARPQQSAPARGQAQGRTQQSDTRSQQTIPGRTVPQARSQAMPARAPQARPQQSAPVRTQAQSQGNGAQRQESRAPVARPQVQRQPQVMQRPQVQTQAQRQPQVQQRSQAQVQRAPQAQQRPQVQSAPRAQASRQSAPQQSASRAPAQSQGRAQAQSSGGSRQSSPASSNGKANGRKG